MKFKLSILAIAGMLVFSFSSCKKCVVYTYTDDIGDTVGFPKNRTV